jgi:alkylation response protein AidB-like acyl-CoA dehydrogenase
MTDMASDLAGAEGLIAGSEISYRLLRSRANSIEGGTTEVLQNIVAERVLGLPKLR